MAAAGGPNPRKSPWVQHQEIRWVLSRETGKSRNASRTPEITHLVKQIIKAAGNIGIPQGGSFSPLAANVYPTEIDWMFDAIRRQTSQGPYEAVNYHRFADDLVITVSGHYTKRGRAQRALQRFEEQLTLLGVTLNREKTKIVDLLKDEAFGFLGFDLRRVRKGRKLDTTFT